MESTFDNFKEVKSITDEYFVLQEQSKLIIDVAKTKMKEYWEKYFIGNCLKENISNLENSYLIYKVKDIRSVEFNIFNTFRISCACELLIYNDDSDTYKYFGKIDKMFEIESATYYISGYHLLSNFSFEDAIEKSKNTDLKRDKNGNLLNVNDEVIFANDDCEICEGTIKCFKDGKFIIESDTILECERVGKSLIKKD